MAAGTIRTLPTLDAGFACGETVEVVVPVTLPAGRVLADFASFALYLWADPEFPREGSHAFVRANPAADGWVKVSTFAGTPAEASGDTPATVTYTGTLPAAGGYRSHVLAAWAIGGTAGDSCLVYPSWLTLVPGR